MDGDTQHIAPAGDAAAEAIRAICDLNWRGLGADDLVDVAWAYYHFSVQFRENLEIACALHPDDAQLRHLDRGERATDNLSPWPGVAAAGERMNHDEFMRRALLLLPIDDARQRRLEAVGQHYLATVRALDRATRARSIASYEDGGLAAVFRAILTAPSWQGALQLAFRHFLAEHIRLDADPELGHGALCRHLTPDGRVLTLWRAFRHLLVEAAPNLTR